MNDNKPIAIIIYKDGTIQQEGTLPVGFFIQVAQALTAYINQVMIEPQAPPQTSPVEK